MKKALTGKQQKYLEGRILHPEMPKAQVARAAGYSESVALHPQDKIESKPAFQEAYARALDRVVPFEELMGEFRAVAMLPVMKKTGKNSINTNFIKMDALTFLFDAYMRLNSIPPVEVLAEKGSKEAPVLVNVDLGNLICGLPPQSISPSK